ncbi:MAG: hypothetical protein ABL907_17825 [Hyphomicrobium sp.]
MFLYSSAAEAIVVGTTLPRALSEALSSYCPCHYANSIEEAHVKLADAMRRADALKPVIEPMDPIHYGPTNREERILRVAPPKLPSEYERRPLPPVPFLVAVYAAHLDNREVAALDGLAGFDVKILLLIESKQQPSILAYALSRGLAHAAVYIDETGFEKTLHQTLRDLTKRQNLERRSRLAVLLANGPTAFLDDPAITGLIEKRAEERAATEVRLSLKPPGVLFLREETEPEFMLICDSDYLQALNEIADLEKHSSHDEPRQQNAPGFAEHGGAVDPWDLVRGAVALNGGQDWYGCNLPYDSHTRGLFNLL